MTEPPLTVPVSVRGVEFDIGGVCSVNVPPLIATLVPLASG